METMLGSLVSELGNMLGGVLAGSARMFAMLSVFALFQWAQVTQTMRLTIALALAAPVWAGGPLDPIAAGELVPFAAIVVKEAGVGVLIGILAGLPFWTVQAAGDIIDLYRGASLADIVNPFNQDANSVLGPILFLLAAMTFVTADGLAALLDLVYASFEAWPVASLAPHRIPDELLARAGSLVTAMILAAFVVASPVLLLLGAAELALVFIGKGARPMPLDSLTPAIKNLLALLAMPIFVIFLQAYIKADWAAYAAQARALMGLR